MQTVTTLFLWYGRQHPMVINFDCSTLALGRKKSEHKSYMMAHIAGLFQEGNNFLQKTKKYRIFKYRNKRAKFPSFYFMCCQSISWQIWIFFKIFLGISCLLYFMHNQPFFTLVIKLIVKIKLLGSSAFALTWTSPAILSLWASWHCTWPTQRRESF